MKILVRAPNWVGDAVMAIPALQAIRATHADDEIFVLARPVVADLFCGPAVRRSDSRRTITAETIAAGWDANDWPANFAEKNSMPRCCCKMPLTPRGWHGAPAFPSASVTRATRADLLLTQRHSGAARRRNSHARIALLSGIAAPRRMD